MGNFEELLLHRIALSVCSCAHSSMLRPWVDPWVSGSRGNQSLLLPCLVFWHSHVYIWLASFFDAGLYVAQNHNMAKANDYGPSRMNSMNVRLLWPFCIDTSAAFLQKQDGWFLNFQKKKRWEISLLCIVSRDLDSLQSRVGVSKGRAGPSL